MAANETRFTVTFSESINQTLEDLSRRKRKPKAAILREAIGLEKFFQDQEQQGNRILIEREGVVRELIRP